MTKTVEYYFTPVSPWAYLGHERFAKLLRERDATVELFPMDLAKVFPASGGLPLKQRAPQRQAYRMIEMKRWRDFLGLPLVLEPRHFPASGMPAARWVLAAMDHGTERAFAFAGACMRALWADDGDIADEATLAVIAGSQGFDAKTLAARAAEPSIAARYDETTQAAIARNVFGSPTFVYRDELFWGQDRLDFLARALAK